MFKKTKDTELEKCPHSLTTGNRTVTAAISSRMTRYIADNPIRHTFGQILKSALFVVFAVSLWFGWDFPTLIRSALVWHDGLTFKLMVAWFTIYNFSLIRSVVVRSWGWLRENVRLTSTTADTDEPVREFGGLERDELLAFLKDNHDLNQARYLEEYPLTTKNDLTRAIKHLLRVGILTKGANNANVLSDMEWEEVERMVNAAQTPDQLSTIQIIRYPSAFDVRTQLEQ